MVATKNTFFDMMAKKQYQDSVSKVKAILKFNQIFINFKSNYYYDYFIKIMTTNLI